MSVVTKWTDDGSSGTLRYAISTAAAGDTITFDAASLSGKTITLASALPTITNSLAIRGLGAGQLTIHGNHQFRVFNIATGVTVTISDMTISGGYVSGGNKGGGVLNRGDLTITGCLISGNQAVFPGGGGIASDYPGTLTLIDSTISGNSCSMQGGGGVHVLSGLLTITGCTFSGNSGGEGGALYSAGTATIVNSTFFGNSAGSGGAIANDFSLTVTNCTVVGNRATGTVGGGGLYNIIGATLNNTIVAGNVSTKTAYSDIYNVWADHLSADHCLIQNPQTYQPIIEAGCIHDFANVAPLGNYGGPTQTMPSLTGSQAIDHGSNPLAQAAGLVADQRGFCRVYPTNGTVDIGACENNPTTIEVAWTGTGGTNWGTASGLNNWKLVSTGTATDYVNGNQVVFDDSAMGTTVTITAADVSPTSVTFNNTAMNFNINGSKGIAGTAGVLKLGSGTVTMSSPNSYGGMTTVEGGKLVLQGVTRAQAPVLTGAGTDIKDGMLVLDYAGESDPVNSVKNLIAEGRLKSSTADATHGLGWLDNTSTSKISLAYTVYGDADLNGSVGLGDLGRILTNWGTGTRWQDGDVDYSGSVGLSDLGKVLTNWGLSVGSLTPATVVGDASDIKSGPEPETLPLTGTNSLPTPTVFVDAIGNGTGAQGVLIYRNVSRAADNAAVSQPRLRPILADMTARWNAARLNVETLNKLSQIGSAFSDLPVNYLCEGRGGRGLLDDNADRHGRFVDPTPAIDEEFAGNADALKAIEAGAVDRIDLLSVVQHELGHIAGFDDLDALTDSVMNGVLGSGLRRTAVDAAVCLE